MYLARLLHRLSERSGDRIALEDADGRTWRTRDLVGRMFRFGHFLRGIGVGHGERVAILLPDRREFIECDFGAMAAGLVRVPLNPGATDEELAAQIADAEARVLVIDAAFADARARLLDALRGSVEIVVTGGHLPGAHEYEAALSRASDLPPAQPIGPADLASLNYTGGTTGAPKGVMLSQGNICAIVQNALLGRPIGGGDVFLNMRPLWPIAAISVLFHLIGGARIVLGGRFEPEAFLARAQRHRVTRSSLVPTQLVRLLDSSDPRAYDLSALVSIDMGAAKVADEMFERAFEALGPRIAVLYGLTEASWTCYLPPQLLDDTPERRARLMKSVGREFFAYQVETVDPAGQPVARGEVGEITIAGPNVMQGYWRRPEATAAALKGGRLHTGDLGRIDDEGFLYIEGRLKDVIRSGAMSVVPQEVEETLLRHPAVAEAAVIGVPDREWGEIVMAFVALKPGASAAGPAELDAHCRSHLAPHKRPRAFRFLAELPKSHYGKVLKGELAKLGTEGRA